MKIKVAKMAGFCMGVRRALDLVFDAARSRERTARSEDGTAAPLSTLGPLIHNNQALAALEARGVRTVKDLPEVEGGTVVIRAHGAGPALREAIRLRGLSSIDATCPRVVRCQRAVERAASAGRQVLIAGDPDHAEVEALVDFAGGRAETVPTVERAEQVELTPPVTLVAQTTSNWKTYAEIASVLARRLESAGDGALDVVHSLCCSTEERQRETEELAREVDAVVVAGGRHSANTRRLAEVARSLGRPTFHVETAEELRPEELAGFGTIGVTAGASTPAWVTERIVERLAGMDSRARRSVRRAVDAVVGSNVLLAAGAASVTYAAAETARMVPRPETLFLAFTYVFWAYAANRAGEGEVSRFAASARATFFHRHRRGVLAAAGLLSAAALALAFAIGPLVGLALAGADLIAALYSLRILPARIRMRDIPGSKDFLIALAWAFVAVALPRLAEPQSPVPWTGLLIAAAGVFLLGFSAATSLALGDVQSDRLIGQESVAVLLGRGPARVLAAAGAAVVSVGAVAYVWSGIVPPASLGLAFAGGVIFLATLRRRRPGDALAVELAIQTALLAAGPVAALATHLSH